MTLVDSSVLIDILMDDPNWFDWSLAQLEAAALRGPLLTRDARRYQNYFPTATIIAPKD